MLLRFGFNFRPSQAFRVTVCCENSSKRMLWSMAKIDPKSDNFWQKVAPARCTFAHNCTINRRFNNILYRTLALDSSRISFLLVRNAPSVSTKLMTIPNNFSRTMAKKAKSKSKVKKPKIDAEMAEGIVDISNLEARMGDVLENMNHDFATKIPNRITPGFIDNVMVKIPSGKKVPLYEIGLVKTKNDSYIIEIQESFPNAGKTISSAIADTGFNLIPQVRGDTVIVPIPIFTQDQRNTVGKMAKTISDQAKADLRKVRQKGMSDIRKNKEGKSKDLVRRIENMVQNLTDFYTDKIESALDAKTNEILGGKAK